MKSLLVLTLCYISLAQTIPSKTYQIKTAVLAIPENVRAEATVLGYLEDGSFDVLRKGTNNMICLADNPDRAGFSVAGYHKSLDPFMARGRELRAKGKGSEVYETRKKEVTSGKLKLPKGTTLHLYFGDSNEYDAKTNSIKNAHYRYVVYMPFATSESTGLPTSPIIPGAPWLMNAGTFKSHIMISPPRVN